MSVILFVSTGIQFWLTKYYVDVLGFPESDVFLAYAVVSLTGPTTGCAFGKYYLMQVGLSLIKLEAMIILILYSMCFFLLLLELDQLLSYLLFKIFMFWLFCCGWCCISEEL